MRALWLAAGRLALVERELAAPAGEIPVDVSLAGVCQTDLELVKGYMGFTGVPGHEFVGVARSGRWEGRRVVGDINCPCGTCPRCLAGAGNHCGARTVLGILGRHGAFAERLTLPEANLVPLPDGVSDREAVFAEPLAAALHIEDQLDGRIPPRVAVLGDGRLGLLCALALQSLAGVQVVLLGRHRDKLDRVAGRGIETVLADEVPGGESFDLVVEATGRVEGLAQATALTAPQGTLVLKSTLAGAQPVDTAPWVIHEIRLLGSRCGDLRRAVEALSEGRIDPTPLIDRVVPLAEGVEAVAMAGRTGAVKVLVEVER